MTAAQARYLDLMVGCLTRLTFLDAGDEALLRAEGRDWPAHGETMIGVARLRNIIDCVTAVIAEDIPGDLLEAGVWRGGACILMAAVLAAYEAQDPWPNRAVWVADSFAGLPPPDPAFPEDAGDMHWTFEQLCVPADEVRANFARYDLLGPNVRLLEGLFRDTLPGPVGPLAVLRLDADMYSSTWETIFRLYPLVSPGGFVIIDDYNEPNACRKAVDDYRYMAGVSEPLTRVDHSCSFWRKT